MKHLEEKIGMMLVRIGSLTFMVIFILHIFACTFHYVAILNEQDLTWVEASGIVDSSSQLDRYAACKYIIPVFSFIALPCYLAHWDCSRRRCLSQLGIRLTYLLYIFSGSDHVAYTCWPIAPMLSPT
jgi:hypothetical protein